MPLPLPKDIYRDLYNNADSINAGLLFDRGPDHWAEDPKNPERNFIGNASPPTNFLVRVIEAASRVPTTDLLGDLHTRRDKFIEEHLGGTIVRITTVWRVVSGLGMNHVLENGFVWDHNLGVPYLPGSSIKGLIRAWAKDWEPGGLEQYGALFGDTENLGVGQVIVHDAFPSNIPELELDVMNVHGMGGYENPTVITFLTIPASTEFRFGLSPKPGVSPEPDLVAAEELLRSALKTLGIGSKTAVGYGRFE